MRGGAGGGLHLSGGLHITKNNGNRSTTTSNAQERAAALAQAPLGASGSVDAGRPRGHVDPNPSKIVRLLKYTRLWRLVLSRTAVDAPVEGAQFEP